VKEVVVSIEREDENIQERRRKIKKISGLFFSASFVTTTTQRAYFEQYFSVT